MWLKTSDALWLKLHMPHYTIKRWIRYSRRKVYFPSGLLAIEGVDYRKTLCSGGKGYFYELNTETVTPARLDQLRAFVRRSNRQKRAAGYKVRRLRDRGLIGKDAVLECRLKRRKLNQTRCFQCYLSTPPEQREKNWFECRTANLKENKMERDKCTIEGCNNKPVWGTKLKGDPYTEFNVCDKHKNWSEDIEVVYPLEEDA